MRKMVVVTILALFCASCEKDEFNVQNPNVFKFVSQIKEGTYTSYEKGEDGENLWLIMPEFTEEHIPALLELSKDTTHIQFYPINPISSRTPFPNGRDYYILGECLLWTIEGIRNGTKFGSLDPYLVDTSRTESERNKGLNGEEILIVRGIYEDWWNTYKNADWESKNPLEETSYSWF